MKSKKLVILIIAGLGLLLVLMAAAITYTSFLAQGQVAGNSFSTGTPDLLLYKDSSLPPTSQNLSRSIDGVAFSNILPYWTDHLSLKLFNAGTVKLDLHLANALIGNDAALSEKIMVQVAHWNDSNGDGVYQTYELGDVVSQWRTLQNWADEPTYLGELASQATLPLVLNFMVGDIANDVAGKTTSYDFMFDGVGAN